MAEGAGAVEAGAGGDVQLVSKSALLIWIFRWDLGVTRVVENGCKGDDTMAARSNLDLCTSVHLQYLE